MVGGVPQLPQIIDGREEGVDGLVHCQHGPSTAHMMIYGQKSNRIDPLLTEGRKDISTGHR